MTDPRGTAAMSGRSVLLAALAVAALGLVMMGLAAGTVPGAEAAQAERLALTMLAAGVAALAILAGIAALALDRSLEEPPPTARPGLAVSPLRAPPAEVLPPAIAPLRKAA